MKIKVLVGVAVLLFAVSCGPKLNSETAGKVIKSTFNLTEKDVVEILGVSKEASDVMLVKFRINGTEINSKMRHYDKGWQLDEVQNQLGGWIPTATAKDQFAISKTIVAMTDITVITTALADYVTDNGRSPFDKLHSLEKNSELHKMLCPQFAKSLPTSDPWGRPYQVYCGESIDGSLFGIPPGGADGFLVISFGRDGEKENWIYDPKDPEAGLYYGSDPDKDLIMWNGQFIRGPKRD